MVVLVGPSSMTWQQGIVPFFAWNTQSNTKPYSLSGIGMHLNTNFENAQQVFRLAGTGTNIAVITFEDDTPFKISQGNTVRLQVICDRTDTMVATSFEGVLPLFYFQEGVGAKQMIESTLNLHLYPALDQAFTVFRDQSLQEGLDYAGISKDGVSRQHEAINAPLPEIEPPFEGNLEDLPHAHFPTSRPIGIH